MIQVNVNIIVLCFLHRWEAIHQFIIQTARVAYDVVTVLFVNRLVGDKQTTTSSVMADLMDWATCQSRCVFRHFNCEGQSTAQNAYPLNIMFISYISKGPTSFWMEGMSLDWSTSDWSTSDWSTSDWSTFDWSTSDWSTWPRRSYNYYFLSSAQSTNSGK